MKRYFFLLIASLMVACGVPEDEFLIRGRISNVEDGAMIWLFGVEDGQTKVMGNERIVDGRFSMRGKIAGDAQKLTLTTENHLYSATPLEIWVAGGKKITIVGKDKSIPAWRVRSAIPQNREENRYRRASRELISRQAEVEIRQQKLDANAYILIHELFLPEDTVVLRHRFDSLEIIRVELRTEQLLIDARIMAETPVNAVWMSHLHALAGEIDAATTDTLLTTARKLWEKVPEEERSSEQGKQIAARIFPPEEKE